MAPSRCLAQIVALYGTADMPSAESERVPAGPLLLIIQLGGTNDENGHVDGDIPRRAQVVVQLYRHATAAGRSVVVLTSGGVDPDFSFNPTTTPHWVYAEAALLDAGMEERALLLPGLPALHTVEEALLCRELASRMASRTGCANLELIVVTSDFHAARVRHLFGVSFGTHAGLPVWCEVVAVPSVWTGEARVRREVHEQKALSTLRTAPFGPWREFLDAHGLTAANRSRRFSRRMAATDDLQFLAQGRASGAETPHGGERELAMDPGRPIAGVG
jgi:hypothetical protein